MLITNHEIAPKVERASILRHACMALVGVLALAGCSGNNADPEPTERDNETVLTFDSLGGSGSTAIQVYPGPTEDPVDRTFIDVYQDGDTMPAECRTTGRFVQSDASIGETARSSNEWIRIEGGSADQYASSVYVEDPAALLSSLPDC